MNGMTSLDVLSGLKELQLVDPKENEESGFFNVPKTNKHEITEKEHYCSGNNHDPICVIRTLLFSEGKSMAYSNEKTLSSSFLILNGYMTLSLVDVLSGEPNLLHAKERWGKRLETNIYVGKVSYEEEYRSKDEGYEDADARDDLETSDCGHHHHCSILSQKLERVPYVLYEEASSKLLDPKFYVPESHHTFANYLELQEFQRDIQTYEDILENDKSRYGKDDLVCAIDYHNLGIAYNLLKNFDRAVSCLQKSVLLKRACVGHSEPIIADSLTEIGIIFYNDNRFESAIVVFLEALTIYKDANDNEGAGRTFNNIGCVYYRIGDHENSLKYLRYAEHSQHMVSGKSETAEASLLNFALCQANVGLLKFDLGHLDATVTLEESLLILESVLGDENQTVKRVRDSIVSMHQFYTD
jgi:tetratricopeptide (TPR) repeat protein